jgi:putative ABC transport system permease protein
LRMALGAQPKQIGNQFLSLGLRLLVAGSALGVIGALLTGRAMRSILFDLPALPMAMLAGTSVVLTVVSLLACWLPARRAASVDPMEALRCE